MELPQKSCSFGGQSRTEAPSRLPTRDIERKPEPEWDLESAPGAEGKMLWEFGVGEAAQELLPLGIESQFQPGYVPFMIRHSRDLNPPSPQVKLLVWREGGLQSLSDPYCPSPTDLSSLGSHSTLHDQQDGGRGAWQ